MEAIVKTAGFVAVGDLVSDSSMGPGKVTGITERGFPQVNHVAVTWLRTEAGVEFDPFRRIGDPKYLRQPERG